jgi:phenylacetate-CoA ligase
MNDIRLMRVVRDAWHYVPFYRRHWSAAGIDPMQVRSPLDLARLPVLRKVELLACDASERIDIRYRDRRVRAEPTSGSTGTPFEMRIDSRSLLRRRLRFLRALMAVGYRPGARLMIVSDPPFPQGAKHLRWTYSDLRRGEEAVFEDFLRTRPHVLYGPLSSLLLLARRVAAQAHLRSPPKVVISTAEQLSVGQRDYLSLAFGASVADFYGMTELGLVAWRAPGAAGYRLCERDLRIELLTAVQHGDLERLVVTDLGGGALPLIRFDTGDLVRRDLTRPSAPIVEISGREVDCLQLAGGAVLSPFEVTLALDRVPGIREYQVIQRDARQIDLYVSPSGYDASSAMDRARHALATLCGGVAAITVHLRQSTALRIGQKQRVVCSQVAH